MVPCILAAEARENVLFHGSEIKTESTDIRTEIMRLLEDKI